MLTKEEANGIIDKMFELWTAQQTNWIGRNNNPHVWAYRNPDSNLLEVIIFNQGKILPKLKFYKEFMTYYIHFDFNIGFKDSQGNGRVKIIDENYIIDKKTFDKAQNLFTEFQNSARSEYEILSKQNKEKLVSEFIGS